MFGRGGADPAATGRAGWVRLALARGRTPAGPSVIATRSTNLNRPVAVTSPLTVTATLPGTAASVPIARRIEREALPGCPRAGDLMLTATELVTNTIAQSASGQGGSFTLQLQAGPGWGRIEVTDEGPAEGHPTAGNGWGLEIVAGITDQASAVTQPDGRRTARAEVTWCASNGFSASGYRRPMEPLMRPS